MNWTTERRKLGDLKPWDKNPRKISEDELIRIREGAFNNNAHAACDVIVKRWENFTGKRAELVRGG